MTYEFESEIKESLEFFQKGGTAIQFRSTLMDKGFPAQIASRIAKEAYVKFLINDGKLKIIRGICWFIFGIIVSVSLFFINSTIYGYFLSGCIWGFFRILAGISNLKSANKMLTENSFN